MGFDMTVSHWRLCVANLDTGDGCQLGEFIFAYYKNYAFKHCIK